MCEPVKAFGRCHRSECKPSPRSRSSSRLSLNGKLPFPCRLLEEPQSPTTSLRNRMSPAVNGPLSANSFANQSTKLPHSTRARSTSSAFPQSTTTASANRSKATEPSLPPMKLVSGTDHLTSRGRSDKPKKRTHCTYSFNATGQIDILGNAQLFSSLQLLPTLLPTWRSPMLTQRVSPLNG